LNSLFRGKTAETPGRVILAIEDCFPALRARVTPLQSPRKMKRLFFIFYQHITETQYCQITELPHLKIYTKKSVTVSLKTEGGSNEINGQRETKSDKDHSGKISEGIEKAEKNNFE
jgi:hypothetical protein